ncbi:hypothetical protein BO82DRAFT_213571 [Aspergillus uvarum CBS 121591]|uniref:Uncharacterized protein n=1 Tax=Aspergillus uvarum CBS 121591 TaxID=1448315 RepID=A0A319CH06_9EURO|nr:hypothetical protein BO82DRAFT_213571 [Aspergillus uvarum CBS 121591]PYH84925.1 hypothetical protein BO82DRAFT_213571 [Aspergillus uvarum CBS 121591]
MHGHARLLLPIFFLPCPFPFFDCSYCISYTLFLSLFFSPAVCACELIQIVHGIWHGLLWSLFCSQSCLAIALCNKNLGLCGGTNLLCIPKLCVANLVA